MELLLSIGLYTKPYTEMYKMNPLQITVTLRYFKSNKTKTVCKYITNTSNNKN